MSFPLSASIVAHLTPLPLLLRAAECVLRSSPERLFIIDNSPDDSLARVAEIDNRVVYVHTPNRGFGAAHNIALRSIVEADGCHLVMNPDVWWEGDAITPLVALMESCPDVGMIGPRVVYPDGCLQYTCRMLPTPLDLFMKRFLPSPLRRRRMERYLLETHDHSRPLSAPYLLGSFLIFRNEALRRCGLFDERFFMYPEDIDITRRIHEHYSTLYCPETTVVHAHAAASRKSLRMFAVHLANMVRYFNKWGWLHDEKRSAFNKTLLDSISFIPPEERPPGRG